MGAQIGPRRGSQEGPKGDTSPRGPQGPSSPSSSSRPLPQERPKRPPESPKRAPGKRQESPKRAQESPESFKRAPSQPQVPHKAPKRAQPKYFPRDQEWPPRHHLKFENETLETLRAPEMNPRDHQSPQHGRALKLNPPICLKFPKWERQLRVTRQADGHTDRPIDLQTDRSRS